MHARTPMLCDFPRMARMAISSIYPRTVHMPTQSTDSFVCSGCMGLLVSRCSLWGLCSVLGVG